MLRLSGGVAAWGIAMRVPLADLHCGMNAKHEQQPTSASRCKARSTADASEASGVFGATWPQLDRAQAIGDARAASPAATVTNRLQPRTLMTGLSRMWAD